MKLVSGWNFLPYAVRKHLSARVKERNITAQDLVRLKFWIDTAPEVPEGEWFKDFGNFKIGGEGQFIKTFLEAGMVGYGEPLP